MSLNTAHHSSLDLSSADHHHAHTRGISAGLFIILPLQRCQRASVVPQHEAMRAVEWYSWGSGGGGLLAQGTRDDHHSPTLITAPPFDSPSASSPSSPSAPTSVACSAVYSLVTTADGRLWECGDPLQTVTAAAREDATSSSPLLLPSLLPLPQSVVMVACGWSHCACVTADGRLFTWGDGRFGQLGHSALLSPSSHSSPASSFVRYPTLVPMLHPVTSVACGRRHTLGLLSTHAVLGWGEGRMGQLGGPSAPATAHADPSVLPANISPLPTALSMPILPPSCHVVSVSCGWAFSLLLTSDGAVLASGSNQWQQCAAGAATRAVRQWRLVQGLPSVVEVACGWSHCLARDGAGRVWAWGRRSMGQAGDGRPDDPARTAEVTRVLLGYEQGRATAVRCGSESCVAVDDDGVLWGWGWNEHGNLGQGRQEQQSAGCVWTPQKLLLRNREAGKRRVVTQVTTGGASAFARVAVVDDEQ